MSAAITLASVIFLAVIAYPCCEEFAHYDIAADEFGSQKSQHIAIDLAKAGFILMALELPI